MDPVLILVLVGVAALAGPKLVKIGLANAIFSLDKKSQTNKVLKDKQKKYKESKKLEKQKQKTNTKDNQINQSMTRIQDILFKNIRTNQKEKIRVSEIAEFDDKKDVLLKGRLHIVDSEGKKTVQDIYLFQPRLFSGQTQIGPTPDKFGNLSDEYTYLCRHSGEKDILSGYVPKREIFSGMRFDYVTNSKHSFLERNPQYNVNDLKTLSNIEQYISIDIPTDANGNFIPVNLNNLTELKEFQTYVKRHYMNFKNNGVKPEEYFERELQKAKMSLIKYIEEYEPTYIPVASKIEAQEPEEVKVESSKKAQKSVYDYYNRFNYYMDPKFGARTNNYNGRPIPPHSHHHHR